MSLFSRPSLFVAVTLNLLASSLSMFAPAQAAQSKGKILVVVSSQNKLPLKGGKEFSTGYYLNEMGVPLKALVDAGYEPVFANPNGNAPTRDDSSEDAKFFGNDTKKLAEMKAFIDGQKGLKKPETLAKVAAQNLDSYSAIFVPGGHAPMIDLWKDKNLGTILKYFHAHHKPTAMICHGPIALLAADSNPVAVATAVESKKAPPKNDWIYRDYKMTVFSDAEEKPNENSGKIGGEMKFYPEDALKVAGGKLEINAPFKDKVVVDRELITGQNPFSDETLARELLKALTAKH